MTATPIHEHYILKKPELLTVTEHFKAGEETERDQCLDGWGQNTVSGSGSSSGGDLGGSAHARLGELF